MGRTRSQRWQGQRVELLLRACHLLESWFCSPSSLEPTTEVLDGAGGQEEGDSRNAWAVVTTWWLSCCGLRSGLQQQGSSVC